MSWTIEFHKNAQKEFCELPESIREKFWHFFGEIAEGGINQLSRKHFSPIEKGLWELRARTKDGIARSLYILEEERRLRILLVFVKKMQKTPRDLIELAQKRRSEK